MKQQTVEINVILKTFWPRLYSLTPTLKLTATLSVAVISVAVVAVVYSVESSAYIDTLASLKVSGMSLVKIERSKGPKQLPWGIPDSNWIIFEMLPLKNTLYVLLDK